MSDEYGFNNDRLIISVQVERDGKEIIGHTYSQVYKYPLNLEVAETLINNTIEDYEEYVSKDD